MDFYLIATPIGNLKDVSLRFLTTVSQLNYLVVEDTRQTAKLLQLLKAQFLQYQLWPKQLIRCDQHTERQIVDQVFSLLQKKQAVGLLTDAGMPNIADPGSYLVKQLSQQGVNIELLPGPSALTAAMSLCGFEAQMTLFIGFWPKKVKSILKTIEALYSSKQCKSLNLVFFESPLRVHKTCQLLAQTYNQAQFFLGRELTKKFQTLTWFKASEFDKQQIKPKGEYTVVVHLTML